jgi:hypothetical protein
VQLHCARVVDAVADGFEFELNANELAEWVVVFVELIGEHQSRGVVVGVGANRAQERKALIHALMVTRPASGVQATGVPTPA